MFPDFNRLKIFYCVYKNKSVVAAARELLITQSAVSQHLGKLEQEIGVPLFTRAGKRLIVTPAGERLFEVLMPFVNELDTVLRSIDKERDEPVGLIKIGTPVEFGTGVLPRLIADFRDKNKEVQFHLELGHPTVLLTLLERGKIDFAFADIFLKKSEFSREYAHLSVEPMMAEELIMVSSRRYYREHIRGNHSLANLTKADFISYREEASALRAWFRHHFNKSRLELNIVFSVESVQGVIAGVKNDMGLGIVPGQIVESAIKSGAIVQIATSKKEIVHMVSIVQLQEKVPRLVEKAFIKFAREKIGVG